MGIATFLTLLAVTFLVISALTIYVKLNVAADTDEYYSATQRDREVKKAKKVRQIAILFFIALWILLMVIGSIFTVTEQEQALVLTFNKYTRTANPGLNFKVPFIQTVETVNTMTNGRTFGYLVDDSGYEGSVASQALMVTKDVNFVMTYLYVEWKVVDAYAYRYASVDPLVILDNSLQSEAKRVVGSFTVDDALTSAKTEIQALIKDRVEAEIDSYNIGISIRNITIQDIEPPTQAVLNAFKEVETARQNMSTEMNQAKAYANEIIPAARADADKIIRAAEATRSSRIQEASGQVARFNELYTEYIRNPEITRTRIYYETMEYVLPKMIIYFGEEGNLLKTWNLNGGNGNG